MFTLYQSVDWRRCLCACGGLDSSAWTVPPPPVCLLHNMIYDSTILLFLYYYIREDVGSRFPYTLTKPSQRVRVTWVGHRRRASESGWIAEFGSECRSPILTQFGTFIMNDRSCRHCRFRLRIVTTGLELCAVDLILARLFSPTPTHPMVRESA